VGGEPYQFPCASLGSKAHWGRGVLGRLGAAGSCFSSLPDRAKSHCFTVQTALSDRAPICPATPMLIKVLLLNI